MNESIKLLEEKLSTLDCSQSNIEKTSEEFIIAFKKDENISEDLVKLWKFYCMKKSNKLPFVYLANDIIQNSVYKKINFHEIFFRHLLEVYPLLFHVVNDKTKKEIHRTIDIWYERNIYDSEKLNSLKNLLTPKISIFENLKNPLFPNLIINKKIRIAPKIVDFATSLKNLSNAENKNENILKKIFIEKTKSEINNNSEHNNLNRDNKKEIFPIESLNNIDYSIENNYRGQVLSFCSDSIKKQNQIFFKHVFYLQEIDKMIDKLEKNNLTNKNKENLMDIDKIDIMQKNE